MPNPTIRDLAKLLPYSRTTISAALRGSPLVNAQTGYEIRTAAAAAGFRTNPLASAVMSEMRRSRSGLFRGVLAAVLLEEPDRPAYTSRYFERVVGGARTRASELGFELETLAVNERVPIARLDAILEARGIHGLLLLPAWNLPDFSTLRWERYAGVYADYFIERPALHCICPDHYRSMTECLQRLFDLGYRRPGLIMMQHHDERLHHRWEGAFLAYQQHQAGNVRIPSLVLPEITREKFVAWFRRHRPDVVLAHDSEVMTWMRASGAKIPQTHGFFCLNNALPPAGRCAGLDQRPEMIGARAVEIVIAQLQRNESGIPALGGLTTLAGLWMDGPTIRESAPIARKRATSSRPR